MSSSDTIPEFPDCSLIESDGNWVTELWLIPFNGVRLELEVLYKAVEGLLSKGVLVEDDDILLFFKWFEKFHSYVNEISDVEEKVLRPWLVHKLNIEEDLVDIHIHLLLQLNVVSSFQLKVGSTKAKDLVQEMSIYCSQYGARLLAMCQKKETSLAEQVRACENYNKDKEFIEKEYWKAISKTKDAPAVLISSMLWLDKHTSAELDSAAKQESKQKKKEEKMLKKEEKKELKEEKILQKEEKKEEKRKKKEKHIQIGRWSEDEVEEDEIQETVPVKTRNLLPDVNVRKITSDTAKKLTIFSKNKESDKKSNHIDLVSDSPPKSDGPVSFEPETDKGKKKKESYISLTKVKMQQKRRYRSRIAALRIKNNFPKRSTKILKPIFPHNRHVEEDIEEQLAEIENEEENTVFSE